MTEVTPDPRDSASVSFVQDLPQTDFAQALQRLACSVLTTDEIESGHELDILLAGIEWLRAANNQCDARILIGDFVYGY